MSTRGRAKLGRGDTEFSQAIQSNKMGHTLCFQNPMEDKFCRDQCRKIDKLKARRDVNLYQVQKNFIVTQFFEKGLNPCVAPKCAETGLGLKTCDSKADQVIKQDQSHRVQTKVTDLQAGESDIQDSCLSSMVRSHTLGEIDRQSKSVNFAEKVLGSDVDSANKLPQLVRQNSLRMSRATSMLNIKLNHTPNLPQITEAEVDNKGSLGSCLSQHSNNIETKAVKTTQASARLDIDHLRANPEELFPKMKSLVKHGPAQYVFGPSNHKLTFGLSSVTPEQPKSNQPDASEKDISEKFIKIIQKLTAFIPPHLVETAKNQIRQMSQTDEIYAQKERLLVENKQRVRRELLLQDSRWRQLENKLSPTFESRYAWKRRYNSHWSRCDTTNT